VLCDKKQSRTRFVAQILRKAVHPKWWPLNLLKAQQILKFTGLAEWQGLQQLLIFKGLAE